MKMTKLNKADREWAKGMVADWNGGGGREPHRWPARWFRAMWVQSGISSESLEEIKRMAKQELIGR